MADEYSFASKSSLKLKGVEALIKKKKKKKDKERERENPDIVRVCSSGGGVFSSSFRCSRPSRSTRSASFELDRIRFFLQFQCLQFSWDYLGS